MLYNINMNNDNNLRETNELKIIDKKPKRSYKTLIWSIVILSLSLAIIIALAIGINVAKNGEI